jgi:hypothetical protein
MYNINTKLSLSHLHAVFSYISVVLIWFQGLGPEFVDVINISARSSSHMSIHTWRFCSGSDLTASDDRAVTGCRWKQYFSNTYWESLSTPTTNLIRIRGVSHAPPVGFKLKKDICREFLSARLRSRVVMRCHWVSFTRPGLYWLVYGLHHVMRRVLLRHLQGNPALWIFH